MNLNLQPGLLRELTKQADLNTRVEQLAKRHGASTNATGINAVAFLEKKLTELEEAERAVAKQGYKSLKSALYGLSKQVNYNNVPEDLTIAPEHWVREKEWKRVAVGLRTKTVTVPAVTALQAQDKLNKLLPLLNQVLEDRTTEFINEVRSEFFDPKNSFEHFSECVLDCLAREVGHGETWDTTALPEVEEEEKVISYTPAEEAELQRRLGLPFDAAALVVAD